MFLRYKGKIFHLRYGWEMSAIDRKYVKINNQWQAGMGLRREARGLQAPLQVARKWRENVK